MEGTGVAVAEAVAVPAEERTPKQVIVIRSDLKMRRGKEIAQGAHAAMMWLSDRLRFSQGAPLRLSEAEEAWLADRFTKITCRVRSEEELFAVADKARRAGVTAYLVQDSGRTEFGGVPTFTACAIGPDWADLVDPVTGGLELY